MSKYRGNGVSAGTACIIYALVIIIVLVILFFATGWETDYLLVWLLGKHIPFAGSGLIGILLSTITAGLYPLIALVVILFHYFGIF